MLNHAQCQFLLADNRIDTITKRLNEKKLTNIRLIEPGCERDEGNINLLVNCEGEPETYRILRLQRELAKTFNRDDIKIFVEEELEPELADVFAKSKKQFNRESVKELLNPSMKVNASETDDEIQVVVIIKKNANHPYDLTTIENQMRDAAASIVSLPQANNSVKAH